MTQTAAILKDLQRGKSITPLQALKRHGCLRLAARISNIRDMGYNVKSARVHRFGKTFSEYSL